MELPTFDVGRSSSAPACRGLMFGLVIAAIAGCGTSDPVRELPEAARKSLIRKKVDVQPRRPPARLPKR